LTYSGYVVAVEAAPNDLTWRSKEHNLFVCDSIMQQNEQESVRIYVILCVSISNIYLCHTRSIIDHFIHYLFLQYVPSIGCV